MESAVETLLRVSRQVEASDIDVQAVGVPTSMLYTNRPNRALDQH